MNILLSGYKKLTQLIIVRFYGCLGDILMPKEKEVIAHNLKVACGKSDMTIRRCHSERQRIPSKRLSFADLYPVYPIKAQKNSMKASQFSLFYHAVRYFVGFNWDSFLKIFCNAFPCSIFSCWQYFLPTIN